MRDEVDFLPADKNKHSLQDDSVTLCVRNEIFQRYPKQQVCNIFAIS